MSYHIVSIDAANCSLTCRDGQLVCKSAEGEKKLPLEDVASIIITSWSAQIHSELFLQAAKHGVALIICEAFKPVSLVLPANRSTDTLLSRALLRLPPRTTAQLWQKTVDAKCANQLALAEQLAPGDARLVAMRMTALSKKSYKEAICAKAFWQIFGTVTSGSRRGEEAPINAECGMGNSESGQSLSPSLRPEHPSPALRAPSPLVRRGERDGVRGGGFTGPMRQARVDGVSPTAAATESTFTRTRDGGGLNDLLNYGYAVLLSTVLQKLFGVGLDPTWGISHMPRERATPLAYDLMEPFRPCVDWRVFQWVMQHPDPKDWEVTKEYRRWVTGFPLERVEYLAFTLEIQGVIEGVVRGFRRAVLENKVGFYRPWMRDGEWPTDGGNGG